MEPPKFSPARENLRIKGFSDKGVKRGGIKGGKGGGVSQNKLVPAS